MEDQNRGCSVERERDDVELDKQWARLEPLNETRIESWEGEMQNSRNPREELVVDIVEKQKPKMHTWKGRSRTVDWRREAKSNPQMTGIYLELLMGQPYTLKALLSSGYYSPHGKTWAQHMKNPDSDGQLISHEFIMPQIRLLRK